jgi:sugar phosphate isomerase/epimerase
MTATRRQFLGQVALGAAGALMGRAAGAAIDPINRTRPSHLKLSLAAYSYRQLLADKKLDMFGFVDLAADMGLEAVEPTSYWFPDEVTPEYLHRLRLHAFKLGLDISGTAIRNDFCQPDGPKRDADFEHVRKWIDYAALLDAPVIRIFAGTVPRGDTEDAAAVRAVTGIEQVLPYAAQKGVMLALENHGGITSTPDQLLRLVKAVQGPNFGVNLDTGNFHGSDPYADLARLAPYAINVQVKTEISRAGEKKEEADLARVIGVLREAKYSGHVVLEYEAAEDPMTAVPRTIKQLRKLIA